MEKRRFTAEEKYQILEEARQPGASIAEVCRRHQIGTSLYYKWERDVKQAALTALNGKKHGRSDNNAEVERLQEKISRLRAVISEITEENLALKKTLLI
jgi:transposase